MSVIMVPECAGRAHEHDVGASRWGLFWLWQTSSSFFSSGLKRVPTDTSRHDEAGIKFLPLVDEYDATWQQENEA